MNKIDLPLYSHDNGTFIMIGVFALVIIGLVAAVLLMMRSDKKKKNDQ
jgi:phosphotransferase system  glucose/maltose/N-acetylglucosamine-specific IIC component